MAEKQEKPSKKYKTGEKIILEPDQLKALGAHVKSVVDSALTMRSFKGIDKRWKAWRDSADQKVQPRSVPWVNAASVDSGLVIEAIQVFKSRAVEAIAQDPIVSARFLKASKKPPAVGSKDDDKRIVSDVERIISATINDDAEFIDKSDDVIDDLAVFGTHFSAFWMDSQEIVKRRWAEEGIDRSTPIDLSEEIEETEKKHKANLESIPIEDMIFPLSFEWKKLPWLCWQQFLTEDDLKQNKRFGKLTDIEGALKNLTTRSNIKKESDEPEKVGALETEKLARNWMWWGKWAIVNEGIKHKIVVSYNPESDTIMDVRAWPLHSGEHIFHRAVLIPVKGSVYGIGLPEFLRHQREKANSLESMALNDAVFRSSIMTKYREGMFDPDENPVFPGTSVPFRSQSSDVEFWSPPARSPIELNLLDRTQTRVERLTFTSDAVLGRTKFAGETAKGTIALIEQASVGLSMLTKGLARYIESLARTTHQMLLQFMTPTFEKIVFDNDNPVYVRLRKSDIDADISFIFRGGSVIASKAFNQQIANAKYERLITNPLVAQNPDRVWEVTKQWLLSLEGKIDFAKLIGEKPSESTQQMHGLEGLEGTQGPTSQQLLETLSKLSQLSEPAPDMAGTLP